MPTKMGHSDSFDSLTDRFEIQKPHAMCMHFVCTECRFEYGENSPKDYITVEIIIALPFDITIAESDHSLLWSRWGYVV